MKGELYKVWIQCDKAAKVSTKETTRDTGSRVTYCQFAVIASALAENSFRWTLEASDWAELGPEFGHNHPPSLTAASHPVHRKRKRLKNSLKSLLCRR